MSYQLRGDRLIEAEAAMTTTTDNLRLLAAAATPGPWSVYSHAVEQTGRGTTITCGAWNEYGCGSTENAAYIAAASPDAILAILDALATPPQPASAERDDRLRVAVEWMDKAHGAELRDHYPLAWGNVLRAAERQTDRSQG